MVCHWPLTDMNRPCHPERHRKCTTTKPPFMCTWENMSDDGRDFRNKPVSRNNGMVEQSRLSYMPRRACPCVATAFHSGSAMGASDGAGVRRLGGLWNPPPTAPDGAVRWSSASAVLIMFQRECRREEVHARRTKLTRDQRRQHTRPHAGQLDGDHGARNCTSRDVVQACKGPLHMHWTRTFGSATRKGCSPTTYVD